MYLTDSLRSCCSVSWSIASIMLSDCTTHIGNPLKRYTIWHFYLVSQIGSLPRWKESANRFLRHTGKHSVLHRYDLKFSVKCAFFLWLIYSQYNCYRIAGATNLFKNTLSLPTQSGNQRGSRKQTHPRWHCRDCNLTRPPKIWESQSRLTKYRDCDDSNS